MCVLTTPPHGGHFDTTKHLRLACPDGHPYHVPMRWLKDRFREDIEGWPSSVTRMTVPQRFQTA